MANGQWVKLRSDAPPWFRAPMGELFHPAQMARGTSPARVADEGVPAQNGALVSVGAMRGGARHQRWGDPAATLAYGVAGRRLAGVEEYAGRPCLDVRNDKGRAASDPCAAFCGSGDVDSWRRLAVKLIAAGRAACHRTTPSSCERVEELAAEYAETVSMTGRVRFVTSEAWIREGIAPIAQELACIVTAAAKVGPHPEAPRPLPPRPAVGPGPSPWGVPGELWAGLGVGMVAFAALLLLSR